MNPHIVTNAVCADAGLNALARGPTDIDGESRTNGPRVEIGCDEVWPAGLTGPLVPGIWVSTTNAVGSRASRS